MRQHQRTSSDQVRTAQDNPRDIKWGPEEWPSDRYMEYLLSTGVAPPQMTKEQYYAAREKKRELYTQVRRTEKVLKELNDVYSVINKMLRLENISGAERDELAHHLEEVGVLRDKAAASLELVRDQHVDLVKMALPTVHWIEQYRPFTSTWAYAKYEASSGRPPRRVRFRGATYTLTEE